MKPLFIALSIIFTLFLLYVLALKGSRKNPETKYFTSFRYAHRGFHNKPSVPENSLAAFALASERGYGIELDVHLMADGKLAVIHDSSLKRTAGVDVAIESLAEEDLKNYTLEESSERIPTFKEVLSLIDGRIPLLIELKSEGNVVPLCRALLSELEGYGGKYCVESFDPRCVAYMKKNAPRIVRGQLAENFFKDKKSNLSFFLKSALSALILNVWTRPDFVAFKFEDRKGISNSIAKGFWRTAGFVWTIKNEEDMKIAEKEGYSVIFEQFEAK